MKANKQKVIDWNQQHPPGTSVELTNDEGQIEETKTRSEAWLLGSGTPVVMVEGRTGGYLLDRIKPVQRCRLGYCVTRGSHYAGGDESVAEKLEQGICPICGKKTE